MLAQGRAPDYVAPVLAGASLVALPKPSGGVRPIAVGEILRRLTSKCLMATVRAEARSFFYPAQVGVAVPGGTEKVIHTVRAWWGRHRAGPLPKLLLKLDFANAFNTVSRNSILPTVRDHFPALARWTTWCYRQPTRLQFATHTLESHSGVQQGDPLGPLLFSAALQPLASDLRRCGLDIAVHYLDDGVLAGDVVAVSRLKQVRARRSGPCRFGRAPHAIPRCPPPRCRWCQQSVFPLRALRGCPWRRGVCSPILWNELLKLATSLMPLASYLIPKLACNFCVPALGLPRLSTTCGVILRTPNIWPSACSMEWCDAASETSLGFTPTVPNGTRHR